MSNKNAASHFLKTCALGRPKEAFALYASHDFIHHNQYFHGDRASLLQAMEEADKTMPNKGFEIKQVLEDGDRVMTYSHVIKEAMDIAVVHIFRFEYGKIVEMWDLGQVIAKDSPNENGLF